ncbi:hypothetical protein ASE63_26170 [Bosea sp. Root381]|nr:hypothetical protein ASE63_26170 [Bosea sp. Root381]
MTGSVAPELNVLKNNIYGSVSKLALAVGVGERVIRYLIGWPNRRIASPMARRQIVDLFATHYPFPLPEGLADLRLMLNAAKQHPGSHELLACINTIRYVVSFPQVGAFAQVGALYMFYMACHAQAMLSRKQAMFGSEKRHRSILDDGIKALEAGRQLVATTLQESPDHPYAKKLRELDAYLLLNQVIARGLYIADKSEIDCAGVVEDLRKNNAIELFDKAMKDAPWEWRLAYNGLDIANRLNASDDVLMQFYGPLLAFDRGFSDPGYTPGEVLSIDKNPDWKHLQNRLKSKRFKAKVSAHLESIK